MFVLAAKLRYLKVTKVNIFLRNGTKIFDNIHLKVTKASKEVNMIQSLINVACYSDDLALDEKRVQLILYKILHMQNQY